MHCKQVDLLDPGGIGGEWFVCISNAVTIPQVIIPHPPCHHPPCMAQVIFTCVYNSLGMVKAVFTCV